MITSCYGTEHCWCLPCWIFSLLFLKPPLSVHGQIFALYLEANEQWRGIFPHYLHNNQEQGLQAWLVLSALPAVILNLGFRILHWEILQSQGGWHFSVPLFWSRKERIHISEALISIFSPIFRSTKCWNLYLMLSSLQRIDSYGQWGLRVHDIADLISLLLVSKIIYIWTLIHWCFLSMMLLCSYISSSFIRLTLSSLNNLNNHLFYNLFCEARRNLKLILIVLRQRVIVYCVVELRTEQSFELVFDLFMNLLIEGSRFFNVKWLTSDQMRQ